MGVGPGGGVDVIRPPFKTKLQFYQVVHIVGFKSQLLCGVRIEMAVDPSLIPGSGLELCRAHSACPEEGLI